MDTQNKSVWDVLIDDADEAGDLKNLSDYLILIGVRLNGQSGNKADKAKQFGLSADQVRDLMKGRINKFSLDELTAIARKIGVTARI